MILLYLKPLMLVIMFAGLLTTAVEVTFAMWQTNVPVVVAVCVIFTAFWIGLLMEYLDQRVIEKINKIRYDI